MRRGSGLAAIAVAVCGRRLAHVPWRPGARRPPARRNSRRQCREAPEAGVAGGDERRGERHSCRRRWSGSRSERGRRCRRLSGRLWGQDLAGRRPRRHLGVARHRWRASDRRQLERAHLRLRYERGRHALGREAAGCTTGDLVVACRLRPARSRRRRLAVRRQTSRSGPGRRARSGHGKPGVGVVRAGRLWSRRWHLVDAGVLAFDVATGRRLWMTSFHPDAGRDVDVGATPIVLRAAGREEVAVGSDAGVFKLLDAATGSVAWSRDLVNGSAVHGLLASPAYDGTYFYVPSAGDPAGIFAVDAAGGKAAWANHAGLSVYSAPALGNGVVVFGTGDVFGDPNAGGMVALSSRDGTVLWTHDLHSAVFSGP